MLRYALALLLLVLCLAALVGCGQPPSCGCNHLPPTPTPSIPASTT
jgi:hypothetical protein